MDLIEIRGLRVFGRHGVLREEQSRGQPFVVDITLEVDLSRPARSDELGDTVDYATVAQTVAEAVQTTRFDLIEALAGHLADVAMSDPAVKGVTVRVAKPEAPLTVEVDEVAVVLRRQRGGSA